jgi:hypothetical protein
MHEAFRRRIETLEEERKQQNEPVRITHVAFVHADGRQVEATVASGPANFVCHRGIGEELDAFKSRASDECRAASPRGPVVLVFMEEQSHAT